ncbi:hypothetical protein [Paenibacillus paridis]|uniref:hypothetical protein n=1 Tax=Paenibacillus paridis TaxID=2583376 RepID=UPI0011210811|nr:hypothetical protein [Paenibacillus paridis]
MTRIRAMATIFTVVAVMLAMAGCGKVGEKRSPEEWLSLSYSGLAATDQYAFTGSMSIKTAAGLEFKPEIFEGKVVDHQQLTLQSNGEDPLHWNPVQVLEALNNENEEVAISEGPYEPGTIILLVTEPPRVSKARWEERLRLQLEQLGTNAPAKDNPGRAEWSKELERSRQKLETMLSSMQAATQYELTIDRDRLLPLKMEEKTTFSYKYAKQAVTEERHTTVRFQSFDGASSSTVQQSLKRGTIN